MRSSSLARGISTALLGVTAACSSPLESSARDGVDATNAGMTAQAIIGGKPSLNESVIQLAAGGVTDGIHAQVYQKSCSGSLVAKNLVMTARHCVSELGPNGTTFVRDYDASLFYVFTGSDAPTHLADGTRPAAQGASLVLPASNGLSPDIAFIVLAEDIESVSVAALRLTTPAVKGEELTLIGFGRTETGDFPKERRERMGVSVLGVGPFSGATQKAEAGELLIGEGACFGDSGGAAISSRSGAIVGVSSRVQSHRAHSDDDPTAPCVGATAEDIYTSVPAMKTIIDRAFDAAGAKPLVERAGIPNTREAEPLPPATSARPGKGDPTAGSWQGPAAADGACSLSRAPKRTSSPRHGAAYAVGIALGAALLARRRRRD